MNPFLTTKSDRLRQWRDFRKSLSVAQSDLEQVTAIANWWAQAPEGTRVIDPYDQRRWPSGWELIYAGDFCRSSIALGMEQTFLQRNGRWTENRVKLALLDDNGEDIYLVLIIDDTWILNYDHGRVIELSTLEDIQIIRTYAFMGRKHKQIEITGV